MIDPQSHLLALVNAALAMACLIICVCRINGMTRHTRPLVVAEYAVGAGASFGNMFLPWTGIWPNIYTVVITASILLKLVASTHAWRNDEPPTIATDLAPLENAP